MRWLLRLFEKIVPPTLRIPVLAGLAILIIALVFVFGTKAWNGIGNRFHDVKVWIAQKEIKAAKDEAEESKKVTAASIAAFQEAKKMAEEEKAKREIAEKVLADKTKNTDQKLAAYEKAISARPTVTAPQSTDELCERARSLGIPCS